MKGYGGGSGSRVQGQVDEGPAVRGVEQDVVSHVGPADDREGSAMQRVAVREFGEQLASEVMDLAGDGLVRVA
ncbi:hypothetical protein GCM10023317_03870 [Actinopolymorpha pittospori]